MVIRATLAVRNAHLEALLSTREARMKKILLVLACCAVSFGINKSSCAQDVFEQVYGQGVHAYFCNDLNRAEQLLTSVIDAGSQDPRAHYFRGLVQARRGGSGAGYADFQRGAELEIAGRRVVNVGKALERIQGPHRMEIERARTDARLAAKLQSEMMRRSSPSVSPNGMGGADKSDATIDPFASDTDPVDGETVDMPPPSDSGDAMPPTGEVDGGDMFGDPGSEPTTDPAPAGNPFETESTGGDDADSIFGSGDIFGNG